MNAESVRLPDEADYLQSRFDAPEDCNQEYFEIIRPLLANPPRQLTRQQLLARWPADLPSPHPTMLLKALDRALKRGQLAQDGSGRKSDPFRYYLPDLEAP